MELGSDATWGLVVAGIVAMALGLYLMLRRFYVVGFALTVAGAIAVLIAALSRGTM